MSQQYYNEYKSGPILFQQYLGLSIDAAKHATESQQCSKIGNIIWLATTAYAVTLIYPIPSHLKWSKLTLVIENKFLGPVTIEDIKMHPPSDMAILT